jgi:NADH-quinone oxidoreductase subunit I
MGSIRDYFANITNGLGSTARGMSVTFRHFATEPHVTVQYPREVVPLPPTYRGMHILEQEKCIDCNLCAKACPVDCIEIEAEHHGRKLEWQKFTIDYKKCIFCELCIPPCPVDCIHMTSEYEMATDSPDDMVEDLLTWTGLRPQDQKALEGKSDAGAKKPAPKKAAGGGGDDLRARVAAMKAKRDAEKGAE